MVELFVEEMPQRAERLRQTLDAKDWSQLQHLAHQLKGSAGSYGFTELSPVAARLEEMLKENRPEDRLVEAAEKLITTCLCATSEPRPD